MNNNDNGRAKLILKVRQVEVGCVGTDKVHNSDTLQQAPFRGQKHNNNNKKKLFFFSVKSQQSVASFAWR